MRVIPDPALLGSGEVRGRALCNDAESSHVRLVRRTKRVPGDDAHNDCGRPRASAEKTEVHAHMGILAWLLFGLLAGLLARLITPGDEPGGGGLGGILITIVIGIVGAFIGGAIGTALGWGSVTAFDLRSMALAVLGAIVFLLLLRALRGGSRAFA